MFSQTRINVLSLTSFCCLPRLEEDFPDPTDERGERNNKPGQDLISSVIVHGGGKTCSCSFIQTCALHFLSAWSSDYANYYQGLWDCQADEPDELAFHRGDLIYIISKVSIIIIIIIRNNPGRLFKPLSQSRGFWTLCPPLGGNRRSLLCRSSVAGIVPDCPLDSLTQLQEQLQ